MSGLAIASTVFIRIVVTATINFSLARVRLVEGDFCLFGGA
jgi:hypothetical protein